MPKTAPHAKRTQNSNLSRGGSTITDQVHHIVWLEQALVSPTAIAASAVCAIAAVAIQSSQVITSPRFTVRACRTVRTRLAGRIPPPSSPYDREPGIADDRSNPQTNQHTIHGIIASLDICVTVLMNTAAGRERGAQDE